MNDLIDREQAISKLEGLIIARQAWLSDGSAEIRGIDAAICELATLPSTEKIGRWVEEHLVTRDLVYCSECRFGKSLDDHRSYNYCPNCGARMMIE